MSAPTTPRPWNDLKDSGLLWLVNRVVFHPRGYALAIHYTGTFPDLGEATGWSILGDGTEPWTMGDPNADQISQGAKTEDELFALVKALLP